MKIAFSLAVALLALLLPCTGQAAPKPAPPRILVTLRVLEIPSDTPITLDAGLDSARHVYDTLLEKAGSEAIEVSVLTPSEFTGMAAYNRLVVNTFQSHGKVKRVILSAPNSLEATPHINADGTITVTLKTEVSQVPSTAIHSMTATRTFRSGGTLLLGGLSRGFLVDSPHTTPSEMALLQFVTVTLLPAAVAAR